MRENLPLILTALTLLLGGGGLVVWFRAPGQMRTDRLTSDKTRIEITQTIETVYATAMTEMRRLMDEQDERHAKDLDRLNARIDEVQRESERLMAEAAADYLQLHALVPPPPPPLPSWVKRLAHLITKEY